ncbi:MAG: YigZ family protein [Candidatus Lokiarchaeota archaeon]|nr:YigZ family protein [Candidatus Harpocratesius repetitus]
MKKKHRKANHYCYAYRIFESGGIIQNSSDDGEPTGTAGDPILFVLEKRRLVNILVLVIRYFGGIKLGKGGLVRAYGNATIHIIDRLGVQPANNDKKVMK